MDVGTDTEYPREGPTADVADLLHSEHVSYSKKKINIEEQIQLRNCSPICRKFLLIYATI